MQHLRCFQVDAFANTLFKGNPAGKTALNAQQVSKRGGELRCELLGDRVAISGQAITFLE